jgi:hypothetical protein
VQKTANISTRKESKERKLIEIEKEEVKQILDDCRVTPKEVKVIEESLN